MSGALMPVSPVESRADLIDAIASGAKPRAEWRVGTEHEKFSFYLEGNRPVPYEGERGIGALLAGVKAATGSAPVYDGGAVIGLKHGQRAISLEPGGQFELSGAPLVSIHETLAEAAGHLDVSKVVAKTLGIDFLGIGTVPTWSVAEIPAMPKSRYAIMKPYMEKVGTLGTSMMFRSCTIQANVDFDSEADMVKKLRVALALQPIATALFANSPFIDGKLTGYLSFRSHIWLNTDAARTGMLPFVFEEGMGYERYVDYALDVPMYFVVRGGKYINCAGESFRAFLDGRLPQLPGEKPYIEDWENHLSTIFPEVRLKHFLEMRGADMGNLEAIPALSALWTGLLYDEIALNAAWDIIRNWTHADREVLRANVPETALHTEAPGRKLRYGHVSDIARDVVGIAEAGLLRRALLNAKGEDETIYLRPLETTLTLNKTPAERLIDLYNGEWGGDVSKAFETNRL
jgi:glutamate--cysteine ligase